MTFLRRYFVVLLLIFLFVFSSFYQVKPIIADQTVDVTPPITTIWVYCNSYWFPYQTTGGVVRCSTNEANLYVTCSDAIGCDTSPWTISTDGNGSASAGGAQIPTISNNTGYHTITAYSKDLAGNYNGSSGNPYASVTVQFLYSVNGTVYNDVDNSGTINGDPPFTSSLVLVYLDDTNGSPVTGVYTNSANGTYSMTPFTAGNYNVRPVIPSGYKDIVPVSRGLTFPPSQSGFNFLVRGYAISGNVYIDYNHDCVVNDDDNLNSTFTIQASGVVNYPTTGVYTVSNLTSGTYTITDTYIPPDYTLSAGTGCSGNTASRSVTVNNNTGNITGINFFLTPLYTVSGTVYLDVDGSDTINTGDTRVQNVTVTLSNGQPAVSDANGNYIISNIISSSYSINAATPTNYKDVLTILPTGVTSPFPVPPSRTNINFLVRGYKVTGNVYVDYNHDCVFNGDDSLGSTFTIQASSGNVNYPTTGVYTVTNLTAGTYTITDTYIPSGYTLSSGSGCSGNTASRSVTVNNGTGNITGINFFLTPYYTVSGTVYLDVDGSDTINTGDTRVQNVTVTLSNGQPAVSDASGNYTISDVISGSYSISAATPPYYKDVLTIFPTGVSSTFPVPPSQSNINFLVRGYKISGTVYNDKNHDCVFNGSDTLYSGATLRLNIGGLTYTTGANGTYSFINRPSDANPPPTTSTITLDETTITGYTLSTGTGCSGNTKVRSTPLPPDQTNINYYVTQYYSITGNVNLDYNHNCVFDSDVYGTDAATNAYSIAANGGNVSYPATGTYTVANLVSNTYTVTISPSGYVLYTQSPCAANTASRSIVVPPDVTPSFNPNPPPVSSNFFITPQYSITAQVTIDYHHNASIDAGDIRYSSGAQVELQDVNGTPLSTGTTNTNGEYVFANLFTADYKVKITVPAGYIMSINKPTTQGTVLSTNRTLDFYITPLYSISGNIFVDTNKSNCKDGSYAGCTNGSESNYNGGQSELTMTHLVTGESRKITTNTGAYTGYISGTALVSGQWKVEYTSLPTSLGYKMTYPTNIGNASFTVVVGKPGTPNDINDKEYSCNPNNTAPPYYYETSSCWDDPTVAADNQGTGGGSIHDLNFGISNSFPWLRCTGGGNCRFDSGIDDPVPAAADLACGGSYASITNTISNSPSIFFSGNNSYSFCAAGVCQDRASEKQWVVGNNSSASFAPVNSGVVRTSYNYLLTTAKQSGITPVDLASYCTLSNCILPTDLPNGLYHANGDLVIDTNPSGGTYTFPANKNFVILVNGNLTIKAGIKVPIGSTATFSSAKSIIVDTSLGVSSPYTSNTATVEGFYSADESFNTGGINNCVIGPDKRLNLAGSFVVGANGSGTGKFLYTRDLCAANLRCPAIAIYGRPDFLLNAPDFIKHPNFIWQEAAP